MVGRFACGFRVTPVLILTPDTHTHRNMRARTHTHRCLFEIAVRFHANRDYDVLPLESNRRVFMLVCVCACMLACR